MSLFAPTAVGTERFKMKGMALEIRLQSTSSDMAEQCCVAQTWVGCVGTQSLHGLFLSGVKVQCKANTITSSPKMCLFLFPVSNLLPWNRALIFSIPNSRAGGIAKARYQITRERVKTFGCSFTGSHSTPKRPFSSAPKSVLKPCKGNHLFSKSVLGKDSVCKESSYE